MSLYSKSLHNVPAADSTNNVTVEDAIGNKTDAATTTVGTTSSIMKYIKGLLGLHPVPTADVTTNTSMRDVIGNKTDTIKGDSVVGFLKRSNPILVSKSNVCNGNGAQTDNLFTVTGYVELVRVWAECSQVTNGVTLSNNYLDLYDGSASVEITDSASPLDMSGAIEAGEIVVKNGASATVALVAMHNAAGAVTDGAISTGTTLTKKTGASTYIRHCFTGDANTNVTFVWYVEYKPLSTDGAVTAV